MEAKTMDLKKVQTTNVTPKETESSTRQVFDFFGDIKSEFNKISWTDPEELRLYTKMVVGATFIMGMGLYLVDLLIQGSLIGLGNIIRFLFG